jgi:hypothetical protein
VYFIYPKDGSYIDPNPVTRFGLLNMGVAPANFDKLREADLPPLDQSIPNDFRHLHLGAGQTEAKITLTTGKHRLRLLFADARHVPHDPPSLFAGDLCHGDPDGRPPRWRRRPGHR